MPACGTAGFYYACLTSARLSCKIAQEHFVHHAFEANVHRIDLTLGKSDDLHIVKGQYFVDCCSVSLIAGEAIQSFGDDNIKFAIGCAAYQLLNAWSGDHRPA
ncbi:MAG: hypothetical protein AAFZ91_15540 [Pseudomonadota bacterium]